MTVEDLMLPWTVEASLGLCLVLTKDQYERWLVVRESLCDYRYWPTPYPLTDGRFELGASILCTEIYDLHSAWLVDDVLKRVEVLPEAEVATLRPYAPSPL